MNPEQKIKLFLTIGLIAVDQVTKFVALTLNVATANAGIAFGLGASLGVDLLVGVAIVVGLLFWWSRNLDTGVASLLLVSGAMSNLIDRVLHGAVIDWLPVPGLSLVNNIADWYIGLAIGWFVLMYVRKRLGITSQ